jgi:hypothetical protein
MLQINSRKTQQYIIKTQSQLHVSAQIKPGCVQPEDGFGSAETCSSDYVAAIKNCVRQLHVVSVAFHSVRLFVRLFACKNSRTDQWIFMKSDTGNFLRF